MLDGKAPIPAERTLLATGITDFAMRSKHQGYIRLETPELSIPYQAPEHIPDTGNGAELPADWRDDADGCNVNQVIRPGKRISS